jgi:hypothetical protein
MASPRAFAADAKDDIVLIRVPARVSGRARVIQMPLRNALSRTRCFPGERPPAPPPYAPASSSCGAPARLTHVLLPLVRSQMSAADLDGMSFSALLLAREGGPSEEVSGGRRVCRTEVEPTLVALAVAQDGTAVPVGRKRGLVTLDVCADSAPVLAPLEGLERPYISLPSAVPAPALAVSGFLGPRTKRPAVAAAAAAGAPAVSTKKARDKKKRL